MSINNQEEEKKGYKERLHQRKHGARSSINNQEERNLTNPLVLPFMKTLRFIDKTLSCLRGIYFIFSAGLAQPAFGFLNLMVFVLCSARW